MPARATRVALVAAAIAATMMLAGCGGAGDAAAPRESAAPAAVGPLAADGLQDPRAPAAEDARSAAPVRVRIPAIGVDSGLESLGVDGTGRLTAPGDWNTAGWFSGGVVPGDVGPAIIAGHIDSPTGPAVFLRLGDLATGDEILVTLSDGEELTFAVTAHRQTAKAQFPTSEVYSNVPVPELRLITCAGAFDSGVGHYTDNLIVYATLRS